jgi:D-proline reductase (dithiol) PrdB
MSLEYLPIMAQAGAPKPPRVLVSPSQQAWSVVTKPVSESRVALLSSAALRLDDQEPFVPREDMSYRRVPLRSGRRHNCYRPPLRYRSGTQTGSGNRFPRTALASLAQRGVIGALSPYHFSFMGGVRRSQEIEDELAMAIAADLKKLAVDLALLVPY